MNELPMAPPVNAPPAWIKIAIFVCLAHSALIFSLCTLSTEKPSTPKRNRLAVQTIALSPKIEPSAPLQSDALPASPPLPKEVAKEVAIEASPPPMAEPPAVKKNLPPKAEVKPMPKPVQTPVKDKKKEVVQQNISPSQKKADSSKKINLPAKADSAKEDKAEKARQEAKQQALVSKAQAHLAKIKNARLQSTPIAGKAIPAIDKLHVDALPLENSKLPSIAESRYQDELSSRLKLMLKLPEQGDVKLKLTLERSGKVAHVEILSSESLANQKYLREKVPALTFPSYGNHFGGVSKYTFTIILQSEL